MAGILTARSLATTGAGDPARQAASMLACQDAAWMGGSCACHFRRRLHMGAWRFAAIECSGVKPKGGGREKIFLCFLDFIDFGISSQ